MSGRPDFIIIGAGAVGLASALELLQAGYRVTMVERGAAGQEASWAGGGIMSPLCPWDYGEPVTRLALRGMDRLGDVAAQLHAATGIDPEYRRSGMLVLPPYRRQQALSWCAEHRFPVEEIALDALMPPLRGEALLLPEVAQVRNPRLLNALRRRVGMLGGTLLEHCEVQGFEIVAGRIAALRTSQGRLEAGAFVVTAGAWSRELLGEYALGMDIRPIRGQILLFRFETPPFRHILLKQNLYLIPRDDGHVLAGSTLEDAGFDRSITAEARDTLMQGIRDIFPGWQAELVRQWSGFRPGTPDNIPVIGRHPQLANLYANTGHFRYGVTMSLASAELLRNAIEDRPQPFDTAAYRWR